MTTPTTLDATTAAPRPHGRGLDLVAPRPLLTGPIDVAFRLTPGDRPLVERGFGITGAARENLHSIRAALEGLVNGFAPG